MSAEMFKSVWIQCNKCGVQFDNPSGIRLCCTSCSHLLCERCFREPCPVCQKPFEKVLLGPSMPPQVKIYFEEMPKLVVLLQKIAKFQSDQRNSLVARKYGIFDKIFKARQAKAALDKNSKIIQEKMRATLKKISEAKEFIYDCERRKERRLEQERIAQYFTPAASTNRQANTFFNQHGSAENMIRAHAASSGRRFNELPSTSGVDNRSFSRNIDSGNISNFSPGIRTPGQERQNTPSRIGDQINKSTPFLNELRRRRFSPYGNKPQFTTPVQTFRPPKDPRYM